LVSPLFSQVVIDKVLVHRGLTTLNVLVFGLVTVSMFESQHGGLIGARLFRHLMALPIAYFEARCAVGSVARVRELVNIRNFLTSP
jgi:subfamily B ATP-binding cassette protein HlyB/CyaB